MGAIATASENCVRRLEEQGLKIMLLTHGIEVELPRASRLRYMRFDDYVLTYLVAAEEVS